MYVSEIKLRVRYAETDKMGYCHHGNYAQFFEMGRTELMREVGLSYKELEERGVMLPVLELKTTFFANIFLEYATKHLQNLLLNAHLLVL